MHKSIHYSYVNCNLKYMPFSPLTPTGNWQHFILLKFNPHSLSLWGNFWVSWRQMTKLYHRLFLENILPKRLCPRNRITILFSARDTQHSFYNSKGYLDLSYLKGSFSDPTLDFFLLNFILTFILAWSRIVLYFYKILFHMVTADISNTYSCLSKVFLYMWLT